MGLVNQALNIGRSALLSYQSALQVIGNNISNAGSADYTRQTPGLSPMNSTSLPEGMRPGAGVALTSLKRNLDEGLENRIRAAIGADQSFQAQQRSSTVVETLFDPLTGLQAESRITDFFNQINEVQNTPADNAVRELAISNADALAGTLRELRTRLGETVDDLNDEIGALVGEANQLGDQIAQLNTEIVTTEASGSPASALRDQRDALLRDLGEIVNVRVQTQPDGAVNVQIGNENLIQGGVSRGLTVVKRLDGEFERSEIGFADTNSRVIPRGGQLAGLIEARERGAIGRISQVDRLAAALVFEVNKVYSDGQGVGGFTSLTSTAAVDDPTAALNSDAAGLGFDPVNGTFHLAVTDDATGGVVSYPVAVDLDGIGDDDTTLESLVAAINDEVEGVTASITADHRLSLEADAGMSFTFGYDGQTQRPDTSHVLAALGVNTLFSGSDAADIRVNQTVLDDPSLFAAAAVNLAGDGANAGRLALTADAASDMLGGLSARAFYAGIADDVAVDAAGVREGAEAAQTVLNSLQAQKENISGVSLDEEAIELVKFQRAYQGAARFVSVVDRLTSELIALVN